MAIARDCKSLAFGLQRFESSLSHCPLTMLLKGVTDAQRLRIVEVFRQGFLGLFEMNKSWIYGGVVECRHARIRIWYQQWCESSSLSIPTDTTLRADVLVGHDTVIVIVLFLIMYRLSLTEHRPEITSKVPMWEGSSKYFLLEKEFVKVNR